MSHNSVDVQLDLLESQVNDVGVSLLVGDPVAAQACAARLQQLAVELVQVSNSFGQLGYESPRRARRIKALFHATAGLRENLFRQLAYVDRALEIVVPVIREKSTYSGAGTYGKPVRQSGAISVLAA
jgi:hypothetical protein